MLLQTLKHFAKTETSCGTSNASGTNDPRYFIGEDDMTERHVFYYHKSYSGEFRKPETFSQAL